ncbi:hypothetical protein D5086_025620 [Populus alba]|uniref:Uncharacterized protein n=1 Tax=Populus alba TaxID=43335 RepID=A0ACC4B0D9_POPAL
MCSTSVLGLISMMIFILFLLTTGAVSVLDYGAALTKSLLYYEAQRSGKLPPNQRVLWRGDSGLQDGSDAQFGFPMAFTVTVLAWSTVEFQSQLEAKNELSNAMDAIKRGTDYFIKAHPQPDVLYGEDGDGDSDHSSEAAAAFAAASVAFKPSNPTYICN